MTDMRTIAILEPGYADYRHEAAILADHRVEVVPVRVGDDAVPSLKKINPLAIMVRERPVTAAEIDACPNLRIIVRYGVGVDNVDIPHATARGIYVANVPDYGADIEVSEHALALYLAVQRRIPARDAQVRGGQWDIGQDAVIPARDGAVLGLVGCGRIGLATARKFRALGFGRVLAHDPFLTKGAEDIALVDMETLCTQADVVSLHAPLTPETRHILNADLIARMKPDAVVVNVSRGGLVDEAALAEALTDGRLLGAGIDVFETEPIRPDNPLLTAPNTVLTDHMAWYSERSVRALQEKAAAEVDRVLAGGTPKSWLNRWSDQPA